jgi:DNA-binding transcriptional ArsR family regulator
MPARTAPLSFQPGFSAMAALMADPAREAMLVALADGRALPAGELASAAGISAQSASRHLARLVGGGVLTMWSQGRWRYYKIKDEAVIRAIESLCVLAHQPDTHRRRPPADLCYARCCYSHLAGQVGVAVMAMLRARKLVATGPGQQEASLTAAGVRWMKDEQIWPDVTPKAAARLCMDWTQREPHLAGAVGRAILAFLLERRYVRRNAGTRVLTLTAEGRGWLSRQGVAVPEMRKTVARAS